MPTNEDEVTSVVRITVQDARPVISRSLFALVDVEVDIEGVALTIRGVQARRLASGGTDVLMPSTRRQDGSWAPAVELPHDLANTVVVTVLNFLVEQSLAHDRLGGSYPSHLLAPQLVSGQP